MTADGVNNQEFVAARQDKWNTPPEIVLSQAQKALGVKVTIESRLKLGGWNEVYVLSSPQTKFILRIAHTHNPFPAEGFAKAKAAAMGVPIPETLAVSEVGIDTRPAYLEFSRFLDGHSLATLGNEPTQVKSELLTQAGHHLSQIHSVHLPIYGQLVDSYPASAQSLASFKIGQLEAIKSLVIEGLSRINISQSVIEAVLDKVRQSYSVFDEDQPALVHMDYLPRHIFVSRDKTKVIGIIDFGNCRSTSPFDDLANWVEGEFKLTDLLAGYDNRKLVEAADFERKLTLARLFLNLQQIPFVLKHNLTDKLLPISERILKYSDMLR